MPQIRLYCQALDLRKPTGHRLTAQVMFAALPLLFACLPFAWLSCRSYVVCLGLLLPAWAFTGLDSAECMAEETPTNLLLPA